MYPNLNPTKINQPANVYIYASMSIEALEQADLLSALEEQTNQSLADQLSQKASRMDAIPAVDPDDFEAAYLWFLS